MTQAVRDTVIGITSIVALLGISVLLFLFGELDPLFNPRYPITVTINDAGGVRPGSVVELNGVSVGIVDTVRNREDDDDTGLVRIAALVERDIAVPADVTARVSRSLIGGAATLQLVSSAAEPGPAPAVLPTDGSARVQGEHRPLLDEVAAAIDERLEPLARRLDGLDQLTTTYVTLGENLNDLVRPVDDDGSAGAEPNLRTLVANLDSTVTDLKRTVHLAEDWLDDEQMRGDLQVTLERARDAAGKIDATLDRYGRLADELAASADDVTSRLGPVADDLSLTLQEIRRVTRLATDGQGTAGRLLTNPDLYNALTDAAERLDRVLVQLQLLIEKVKAEGLRVGS